MPVVILGFWVNLAIRDFLVVRRAFKPFQSRVILLFLPILHALIIKTVVDVSNWFGCAL
jgi:hypothetical protein